ncbi:Bgt-3855 [Blumeria graminis f. sp. tritici]|uniref:Bgt-3855 n=2 Tax=Blumeria graminis f. sp. tritici TaxID=62690 RepID=A0A381LDC7_BLUGR|nr:hypothetical protein BGT96224_3855 [Blumeria graminis f. sp. tritici 96224]VDB93295.1 Bgt-3855 [Blumeria graminis f. sp. tritici]
MKILSQLEEEKHYDATVTGGLIGGSLGLTAGLVAIYVGQRRFPIIRDLTIPMKSFLVTSTGTFSAIISADRASRDFEKHRDPSRQYRDQASIQTERLDSQKPIVQRLKDWGNTNRYSLVTASWVASMGTAFAIVSRNKYITGAQKLVQARIYAQGLTLAVLIATAALEVGDARSGKGRWETVTVLETDDSNNTHLVEKRIHHESYPGQDLWKDIVAAEERKIEAQKAAKLEENNQRASRSLSTD